MEMDVKFFFLSVIFIVMLSEAELNLSKRFAPPYSKINILINYLFPKEPGIIRVRNAEEARGINQVTTLDFIGLVEKYGYPAEEHSVTTEDGYNLKIHRIPGSPRSNNKNKPVVFIMHGILCSSDCWVLLGPNKDLSFLLADEGYDVWFGNFRGNSYCRSHVTMSPQDANFWQFSFHEIGVKDLPVMIDYVLNYTKHKNLHYIAHSMGTTVSFVLLSTRPEYNAKIKLGLCLAPVAIWKEVDPLIKFLSRMAPQIKEFLDNNDINEVGSLSSTSITVGRFLCADNKITQPFCVSFLFSLAGSDPTQLNTTMIPKIFSHYPAGTSKKTLLHYYQNIITGNFQNFDYGYVGNYMRYKQATPVKYDLKKITVPLALFYGANDIITMNNPVQLYKQLPNAILLEENPHKLFTHLDFMWAIDAKTLLYDRLIEVMKKN